MSDAKPVPDSPALADQESDEFTGLMEVLDWYFHVTSCPNHTAEERRNAFLEARNAYMAFAYDEDEIPEGKVVGGNHDRLARTETADTPLDASGPRPGDKVH